MRRDPHQNDDGSSRVPNRVQLDFLGDGLFQFSTFEDDVLISRETGRDLDWYLIATKIIAECEHGRTADQDPETAWRLG